MKTKMMCVLLVYLFIIDKPARVNIIKESVFYKPTIELYNKS
jgi:hypothetical protein